jgi:hypothetical protein
MEITKWNFYRNHVLGFTDERWVFLTRPIKHWPFFLVLGDNKCWQVNRSSLGERSEGKIPNVQSWS